MFDIPPLIRAQHPDAVHYTPTAHIVLPLILPYIRSDDVFFDLGCGKGRVVCYLARHRRLRKVVGVEMVPELVGAARKNIQAIEHRLLTPVEIVEGDAAKVDLSQGTIYFLNNPFGEETMLQVLENIGRNLAANPRRIRILYLNPECARILDNTSWLESEGISQSFGLLFFTSNFRVWTNFPTHKNTPTTTVQIVTHQ